MNQSTFITKSIRTRTGRRWSRYGVLSALLLLGAAFLLVNRGWRSDPVTLAATERTVISIGELEERYGLRLKLIGVTAGGGLVDFRLKIVNGDKAQQILGNPERAPGLLVEGSDAMLSVPPPSDQEGGEQLGDGRVFISLLPNSDSVVKPGTSVVVTFGDLQLEPVLAQ